MRPVVLLTAFLLGVGLTGRASAVGQPAAVPRVLGRYETRESSSVTDLPPAAAARAGGSASPPNPDTHSLAARRFAPVVSQPVLLQWCEDATLFDVALLGRTILAVGDHGAVVRSEDGGTTWQVGWCGQDVCLRSLSFLTGRVGWAAGYRVRPHVGRIEGVVLQTRDGGRTWQPVHEQPLPGVLAVRFFDERRGLLLAMEGVGPSPGGVRVTHDGGRTWQPLIDAQQADWRTALFATPALGVVGGRAGRIGLLAGARVLPSRSGLQSRQTVRALALGADETVWAAGDWGLIIRSVSGGVAWEEPPAGIPPYLRDLCDFRTVACDGENVWVAGRPGSVVWHSPDGGRTWRPRLTGQPLPLERLRFVDPQNGIAVGAAGVVLRTRDGGATWQCLRGKQRRAAALCLAPRGAAVPWRFLARFAAEQGYRTAVLVLGRSSPADGPQFDEWGLHDAVVSAGAAYGMLEERIAIEHRDDRYDRESLRRAWLAQTDGRLDRWLVQRLARAIRVWRPSVLVVPEALSDDAAGSFVFEAALRVAGAAGDPSVGIEQQRLAGLSPWRVDRIVVQRPPGSGGTAVVDGTEPLEGCGRLVDDLVWDAAARIVAKPQELAAPGTAFGAVDEQGQPRPLGGSPFAGLVIVPGGDARRAAGTIDDDASVGFVRQVQLRRALAVELGRRLADDRQPAAAEALVAELAGATATIDRDAARRVWWQLFQAAREADRPRAAEQAAWELLRRFPQSDEAESAAAWLLTELTSQERWYQQTRHRGMRRSRTAGGRVRLAAAQEPQDIVGAEQRERRVLELATLVRETIPRLDHSPRWRFLLANHLRRQSRFALAERLWREMLSDTAGRWQQAAAVELWLTQPFSTPPVPVAVCRRNGQRPRLEGVLSDAIWEQARPVFLQPEKGAEAEGDGPRSFVMVAGDAEFLYLAASLPLAEGQPRVEPQYDGRRHDDRLRGWDRVRFELDTDRDRSVTYAITVDQRGRVAEALGEDEAWNPQLYVAIDGAAPDAWRLELAIPWAELVAQRPAGGAIWALRVERIVPHSASEHWPAAPGTGEPTFGLLRFR